MKGDVARRKLAKKTVLTQLDKTLKTQSSTVSEILGRTIPRSEFSKDRNTLRKKANRWVNHAFDTFGTDWNALSLDDKRERIGLFFDKQFRLVGRVPTGTNALIWYRKQMESALTIEGTSRFATSYNRYSKACGWLIHKLLKSGRINIAREPFKQFASSEEGFALAQLFAQQLLPGFASLERLESRSLEPRDVHRLAKLYLTYSGAFEKEARMVVTLNRIQKFGIVDYERLTRQSMAFLEHEIEAEPKLRVLIDGFDRTIRNSIAHGNYTVKVQRRTVTFRDRSKHVTLTWNRFMIATLELSVLVIATAMTPFLHFFRAVLVQLEKLAGLSESENKLKIRR